MQTTHPAEFPISLTPDNHRRVPGTDESTCYAQQLFPGLDRSDCL